MNAITELGTAGATAAAAGVPLAGFADRFAGLFAGLLDNLAQLDAGSDAEPIAAPDEGKREPDETAAAEPAPERSPASASTWATACAFPPLPAFGPVLAADVLQAATETASASGVPAERQPDDGVAAAVLRESNLPAAPTYPADLLSLDSGSGEQMEASGLQSAPRAPARVSIGPRHAAGDKPTSPAAAPAPAGGATSAPARSSKQAVPEPASVPRVEAVNPATLQAMARPPRNTDVNRAATPPTAFSSAGNVQPQPALDARGRFQPGSEPGTRDDGERGLDRARSAAPAVDALTREFSIESRAAAHGRFLDRPASGAGQVHHSRMDPQAPAGDDVTRQLVQAIRVQLRDGVGEARVRLRPEHLGEVRIDLKVEGERVSAVLHVERADVRERVDGQRQELQASLAAHGLQLDELTVEEDGGQRDERSRQHQDQPRRQRRGEAEREFELTT